MYTSLEKMKRYLKIEDTKNDSILENIIRNVSTLFDNYLGFSLLKSEHEETLFIKSEDYLMLNANPINKIKELKIGGVEVTPKRIYQNKVYLDSYHTGDVEIIYEAGYNLSEIGDVEEALIEVVKGSYKNFLDLADDKIKTKKIDTLSISYFTPEELSKNSNFKYETVLNKYKPYNFLSF